MKKQKANNDLEESTLELGYSLHRLAHVFDIPLFPCPIAPQLLYRPGHSKDNWDEEKEKVNAIERKDCGSSYRCDGGSDDKEGQEPIVITLHSSNSAELYYNYSQ
jgi:hypothetical protein